MATNVLINFLFKSKFLRKFSFLIFLSSICINTCNVYNYSVQCGLDDKTPFNCQNGKCSHNKCVCDTGWSGESCQFCSGRLRLWNNSGVITDGPGNYSENNQCTWLIDSDVPGSKLRIYLEHYSTECSWDHLYIYNGGSVYDPLLAVFSGMVSRDLNTASKVPEVLANSGKALLYFYSDAAYNQTGFSIQYRVNGCPKSNGLECSGHGSCVDGKCACSVDRTGNDCSQFICPANCSEHGICLKSERRCDCYHGFAGVDCNQKLELGWWDVFHRIYGLTADTHDAFLQRASHASSVIDKVIWVSGGYSFTAKPFLVSNDSIDGSWKSVTVYNNIEPSPRYGHSSVVYRDQIYIYGGSIVGELETSELWSFDPASLIWTKHRSVPQSFDRDKRRSRRSSNVTNRKGVLRRVRSKGNKIHVPDPTWSAAEKKRKNKDSDENIDPRNDKVSGVKHENFAHRSCLSLSSQISCSPIAVVGHAAVVVDDLMIVIFGYSSPYGPLSLIQEYDFLSGQWRVFKAEGAVVSGTFGHSAVWDSVTKRVFVHGGFESLGANLVVDRVLAYEPYQRKWFIKRPAPVPRFLHSASLSSGLMLIFGGNKHNDTTYFNGTQCYAADFYVYDIHCDTWHVLPTPSYLGVQIARYGHSSVIFNDSMLVLGGFNGQLIGASLVYHFGKCEEFTSRQKCLDAYPGKKCVWNRILDQCEVYQNRDQTAHDFCPSSDARNKGSIDNKYLCNQLTSCHSCLYNSYNCVWCDNGCSYENCSSYSKGILSPEKCGNRNRWWCKTLKTCSLCNMHHDSCIWLEKECASSPNHTTADSTSDKESPSLSDFHKEQDHAASNISLLIGDAKPVCHIPCSQRTSCINCTQGDCIWCRNQQRCVHNKSYLVSFPYGQCREWTTQTRTCPSLGNNSSRCVVYQTCERCHEDIACGWCDDGTKTGTGVCMEGGQLGPVEAATGQLQSHKCDKSQWHFIACPACNCNGHSHCVNDSVCVQPCANNTEGRHCEKCRPSFYGRPINGGLCKLCHCNNHGVSCEPETGVCHCHTKGVTGDHCDRCDTQNNYYGEPLKGSCFYDLQIDYQFTFNLSKQEDSHIRQINFYNVPSKSDVDTDFDIQCSKPVSIKISARQTIGHETWIVRNFTGVAVKRRFFAIEYPFGTAENNTTFHVYVYNFTPPIEIVISFSQHPKLDLIQFFSIFSMCFMVLLLLSFVLWKIKQRYDAYARRHRFMMELEAMASRPFCSLYLELQKPRDYDVKFKSYKLINPQASLKEFTGYTPETSLSSREVLISSENCLAEQNLNPKCPQTPDKKRRKKKRMYSRSSLNDPCRNKLYGNVNHPPFENANSLSLNGALRNRSSIHNGAMLTPQHTQLNLQTPTNFSKMKSENKPNPIALEPCNGNRAAVLSLLVELPTGGSRYTTPGHPGGLAVASSLVSLGAPPFPNSESSFFSKDSAKALTKKATIVRIRDIPQC